MTSDSKPRVALLYPGDCEARQQATPENSRFLKVFQALEALGVEASPAVYNDDFCDEVRQQIMQVHGVLVWVNPIENGRDRSRLDAMLRDVAAAGVFVSTHPDTILKLGTKEVLFETRDFSWGCDTQRYRSLDDMQRELPQKLMAGQIRVLKQYRGHSGNGVWRLERAGGGFDATHSAEELPVYARHAQRGSVEEKIPLREFFERCRPYFTGEGRMIDQAYQSRLSEGMIRCYLVQGKVEGFGHQAINALCPAPAGAPREAAPPSGPRLYHPPTLPQFQSLKQQLENDWVPALRRRLDIPAERLPLLWDCDFMLGPKRASGEDTYVLCEINVSSVSPFPEAAVEPLARALKARVST